MPKNYSIYINNKFLYYDPITEVETIKMILGQKEKAIKDKKWKTRFWIDLYENQYKALIKCGAFELLGFIEEKAGKAKIEKRMRDRLDQQAKAAIDLAVMEDNMTQNKMKEERIKLIKQIGKN